MTKTHAALLFGFTLALASCDESATRPSVTAPDVEPTFDIGAAAQAGVGPFVDMSTLDLGDPSTQQLGTGGKASGHFAMSTPQLGIAEEKYSFTAISTDGPLPFAAKGNVQTKAIAPFVGAFETHARVTCLSIVGNKAWIGAVTTKVVINGQEVPPAGMTQGWKVVDNGEGRDDPRDAASLMRFSGPGFDQTNCVSHIPWEEIPTEEGNIQVRPE